MTLFVIGLICCLAVLVTDLMSFFKYRGLDVNDFRAYSTFFLAGNIGGLFLIAILQAFTTKKEKDWMEKNRERELAP